MIIHLISRLLRKTLSFSKKVENNLGYIWDFINHYHYDEAFHNQKSHFTDYDRYPEIFQEVSSIVINNPKILSFGCSTGLECNTLAKKYYKNSKITGYDISKKVINGNKAKNKNRSISYSYNIKKLGKYDLIFAMSVLCIWPEIDDNPYSFDKFEMTLNAIDELLNKDGYLCIYNSTYLFTDTEISKKYKIIKTKHTNTGFVTKYTKDRSNKIHNYSYLLFQKIVS